MPITSISNALPIVPCLRCGSALPLTTTPRDELYFYTAVLCMGESGMKIETVHIDSKPRGRLCEICTAAFCTWVAPSQEPSP